MLSDIQLMMSMYGIAFSEGKLLYMEKVRQPYVGPKIFEIQGKSFAICGDITNLGIFGLARTQNEANASKQASSTPKQCAFCSNSSELLGYKLL